MLVKAGQDFEAARGVMDLVEGAPEKLRFVPTAMPPIKNKRGKDVNDGGGAPGPKVFAQMKQRPLAEPMVPSHASEEHDSELNRVDQKDPRPPSANPGKAHGRPKIFCEDAARRDRKNQNNHETSVTPGEAIALIDKSCYNH
jgi:hypothetical protein